LPTGVSEFNLLHNHNSSGSGCKEMTAMAFSFSLVQAQVKPNWLRVQKANAARTMERA
jgi:hypothetical protein